MLFPYSKGNSIPCAHLTVTFANRPSPVLREEDEISISGCQQNVLYSIRTNFKPLQGPCTVNVRNEPRHDMACVVKCEPPRIEVETLWVLTWKKGINFWKKWIGCRKQRLASVLLEFKAFPLHDFPHVELCNYFELSNSAELNWFLRCKVEQDLSNGTVRMSQ